jgi:hypothetical protein
MGKSPWLLLAAVPVVGFAQSPTLVENGKQAVYWQGAPVEGAVLVPEACAAAPCGETTLTVALSSAGLDPANSLQVSIRWQGESNDLDLYVYGPDGTLAGQSAGIVSTSESTFIRPVVNGDYRVVVVPAGSDPVAYEGMAQVERPTAALPLRDLLPDLVSLPPRQPQIRTSAYLFDLPVPSVPSGCYPEETAEQGAMRCLRFDQILANVGDGAFEIRYRLDQLATTRNIEQRVYRSDGSSWDRLSDTYEPHPTHAHFHYKNFAQSHLWRADALGRKLGTAPVRSGRKNGFCMVDVELYWWGKRGDAARTYIPPGCLAVNDADPATGYLAAVNGISVGWADVYNWHLADQFIEISGVPDGDYLIESVADPVGTIVERDETNNASFAHIRLCGDNVELVQPGSVSVCP